MKNLLKILTIAILISAPVILFAQSPPHPNGGGIPNGGNTPVGGGAPIGGGLIIMTILGAAYGLKKTFGAKDFKKMLD
ncbi:MAG: hypothetical protein GXO89_02750 [Chlorobi bacterium]|nr:hypothetical protein [Chlorobiota bacterium]